MKTTPRQLLHNLLDYVREQAKNVDPKGFRLSAAKGFLRRRTELVGLPGVTFDLKVEGDHTWLRVERLEAHRPPAPPEHTSDLLVVGSDPFAAPPVVSEAGVKSRINKLRERTPEDALEVAAAEVRTTADASLKAYLPIWQAWAEGERPRRKTIALYAELFALKHQLEAEETARPQELVWGVGVASWNIPVESDRIAFEYPLLTQALEIAIDERSMVLEVRPRATDTRVELDGFTACAVTGATEVEIAAKEHLKRSGAAPVTPFDASSYGDILRLVAGNMDSGGQYREVQGKDEPVPPPGSHLIVTDEWVLLSRPRSNNFLFDDLRRLQEKLEAGADIPSGPLSLVSPPSDEPVRHSEIRFRGLSSRGSGNSGAAASTQELFFPLPYNDEQVTIIQQLEQSPGVTVQGPPGTGKTHTIANIICHYLARGKRVLVTSRGEQALEVLQSKIPEGVRKLTVSLLASDREGVRQFQASIEAIQHQISQLNPDLTQREIAERQSAIDRAHEELALIDRRVDEIAATQLEEIEVDGVPLRAAKMAELALSGTERYGWFDDVIDLNAKHAPPLTQEEASQLRESRRALSDDLHYVGAQLPAPDSLPSVADIARLHEILVRMRRLESRISSGELLPLKASSPDVLSAAQDLLARIDAALEVVAGLEGLGDTWPFALREKCRDVNFKAEREALESLFSDIDALIEARAGFLKRPVDFPERGLTCQKTKEAVKRAAETGKPFGFIAFGAGEAKENVGEARVSGLVPQSTADWQHVDRYLQLHQEILSFQVRWNNFADDLSLPRLEGGVASLRKIELVASAAKNAHKLAMQHDAHLMAKAQNVFQRPPLKAIVSGSNELRSVREQLDDHLTKATLAQATVQLATLQEKLVGKSGPIIDTLRGFALRELGKVDLEPERVAARYAELLAELRRLAELSGHLYRVKDYASRIERAGGEKLAQRIRSEAVGAAGEDSVFPPTWREAWNWARVRTHLQSIEAREELVRLFARRKDLESGLARLYQELVAKSAWLSTKRNATHRVLQALAGYASAIRRIGQGTGPNATRYRRDAREAMFEAAGAVPCWIMSHARISEAMPADIGAFDLIIVDEASQSDLWALPAILRGKKILVVGDDKQVSPDGGFIASTRIDELKARFLTEQPYGNDMTPEKSLYDLAARVFAAHQVMLREHFRCVPAIIAYSNRTFYKDNIQPLRIPSAYERIDPPLVDIYVPHGVRDKHSCNEAEAEAIAEEIAAILNNPSFAGRTIGVVSLLGMEQAKLIDGVVRQRCDAAELLRRRFDCGDARTFQGSERDIMFLSMVVDSKSCKALSGTMYDQRFNVAASRARDRMYLVRSVKVSDLSDKDLRLTLLSHFDKPLIAGDQPAELLIDLCESGFEREVFTRLSERGYRVIPQVRAGAYRIDMVVEGAGDARLAIELDGDEYHGPDRWGYDMTRQRVLERAGWVFWRCFASTWSLQKDEVFAELLSRLQAMGIEPIGAMERVPSLVEKRTWTRANGDSQGADNTASCVLEEAIAQANRENTSGESSTKADAPRAPESASSDGIQTTTESNVAYLITVQQYENGPWWTRAFPAHHTLGALRQANRDQRASGAQDTAAAVSAHVDAVLDKLLEKNISPAAEAAHSKRDEAIRIATEAAEASGWRAVTVG
ncbi:MAG: AAA family ATPase [Thauera sp.]|nr:AAA family ATPase [Thauera sp.]